MLIARRSFCIVARVIGKRSDHIGKRIDLVLYQLSVVCMQLLFECHPFGIITKKSRRCRIPMDLLLLKVKFVIRTDHDLELLYRVIHPLLIPLIGYIVKF